jgi:hypothetical protein
MVLDVKLLQPLQGVGAMSTFRYFMIVLYSYLQQREGDCLHLEP